MTREIRILIVDDHPVVIEGLTMLLSGYDDLKIVGSASGGDEALGKYSALRPDVVLMDLSMPGVDGVEATRLIRQSDDGARVLALTGFLEDQLVSDVLRAGASGYLLKSVGGDELADALRNVAAGRSILSAEALHRLVGDQDGDQSIQRLTSRELEVLEQMTRGLSNKQIGTELGITHGTVRIHVSNILSKLHVPNRTAAAYVAIENGLVPNNRSG